jgi:uncharacterized membrane protein
MKRFIKKDEGNVLAISAFGMAVVIGFAAWTIDVSYFMAARTQLQNAIDAAALAGASGLLVSSNEATNRAILFAGRNTCINVPVPDILAWPVRASSKCLYSIRMILPKTGAALLRL